MFNYSLTSFLYVSATQKIWLTYQEQKNEILTLLERAEDELRHVGSGPSSKDIAADLRSKQDLSVALREATESMLRKLRDLGSSLMAVAAPEKKPVITKEVSFGN